MDAKALELLQRIDNRLAKLEERVETILSRQDRQQDELDKAESDSQRALTQLAAERSRRETLEREVQNVRSKQDRMTWWVVGSLGAWVVAMVGVCANLLVEGLTP